MALQVLIAHTGQRLEVDTTQLSSLDDLKLWVSRKSSVSPQHLVALTPQGRSVKFASLHSEKEIYIYDVRVTQSKSSVNASSLLSETPLPRRFSVSNAPNSIENVQDISSWQELYKERRAWAICIAEECRRRHAAAQERYDEVDVIIKCLDAAVANLEISIKQIEPKYTELKNWVEPALAEHEQLAANWERYLDLARNTPVSSAMVQFMTRRETSKAHPTLEDLIELDTAKKAGKLASTARRRFSDKATDLDEAAKSMYKGLEGLIADFEKLMARSVLSHSNDTGELLEDIEVVVQQIDADYRTALGYGNSQRDIAQASKTASNHTERLVPTLKKRAAEMNDMLQYATKARNDISRESVTFMQAITDITSLHSNVKNQINVLNQSEDDMTTFDYLRLIHQLPYMYASFVVEAIRRREWINKVKMDSSTLANEMALFQDEESKRRRRWQKMVGSTYGPGLETNVMGLEVNLLGDDTPWPSIPKDELDGFLQSLEAQGTDQSIIDDITKLVQELVSPTKQQSKRLKAFKNGSVHEAALGRSGLMIRGDDELLRSLQDDKSKLESKVKTAESRIRRLEDLLHRQSQASRPGNLFQPLAQPYGRQSSASPDKQSRMDEQQGSDGNETLLRRITQLENELKEEQDRSSRFQKDVNNHATRHDDMKDQIQNMKDQIQDMEDEIQEVNSTKKDLLENMEALKREFLDERKSLEDEIKVLRTRLEETEDEIEHFDVSRENEKTSHDEKIQALENEIQRLSTGWSDDTLKMQGQVDFLRKESRMQREQLDASERQVSSLQSENRNVSKKLQVAEEDLEKHRQIFEKLRTELIPDASSLPENTQDLAEALLVKAADIIAKLGNTEHDAAVLRSDLEQATHTTKELRSELTEIKEKLSAEELSAVHLRESLAEEKAKVTTLEDEVSEGRDQLNLLRKQLSDGETGSETLQKRLADEEKKVSKLSEEAAARKSQLGSFEEELRLFREKSDDVHTKLVRSSALYNARDERTKDLTQRLYSQNDRLTRLLERIGYMVSRESDGMTITRLPRLEKSTQNPNDSSDPGTSTRRSVTISSRAMNDSTDLELLYWMGGNDPADEAGKYSAFLTKLGNFDVDLFSETLFHRIKEAEHKARKWAKDVRSYRDRAHAMQKESHDKIAYKHFKEGDLALFLPTRNQQAGAWAAFNVGFPHYFLREQDSHRLRHREWLVARITRIQERVVDLSKNLQQSHESDSINEEENDNPFQLSDGLRWYLIDAVEDKPGAPATPGMGKSTVAANNVEATADMHVHAPKSKGKNRESVASIEGINKSLSKSLESRRSSSGSKKALPFAMGGTGFLKNSSALASETNSLRAAAPDTPSGTSPTHGGPLAMTTAAPVQSEPASENQRAVGSIGEAQKQGVGQAPASAANAGHNSEPRPRPRREESSSPTKRSAGWDSLWNVEFSYGSPSKK